jgi:NADPH2:quinone reductase
VGRFAIQLARAGGAHVTGVSSSPERAEGLAEIGADEVIGELTPGGGRFDAILESVGGASLAAALARVAPWGIVVSFGNSSGQETTFDVSPFYALPGARLYGLRVFDELERTGSGVRDLRFLAERLADGALDPQVTVTRSWREAGETLEDLLERRVRGKAVLTID